MNLELLLDAAKFIEQQEKEDQCLDNENTVNGGGTATPHLYRRPPETPSHNAKGSPELLPDEATLYSRDPLKGVQEVASPVRPFEQLLYEKTPPPCANPREECHVLKRYAAVSPSLGPSPNSPRGPLFTAASSPSMSPNKTPPAPFASSPVGLVAAYGGSSAFDGFYGSSGDSRVEGPVLNGESRGLRPLGSPSFSSDSFEEAAQGKEDQSKKRPGNTPSREVHNKLEKNRRAHLKVCFEILRKQLHSMEDKKVSNQTILKAAQKEIQTLKRKEIEYEHEMERLAREKIAHQQHLATLKKELAARWDHIDFNALADVSSLEQHRDRESKSTTTASEQPDVDDDDDESPGGISCPTPPNSVSPVTLSRSCGVYESPKSLGHCSSGLSDVRLEDFHQKESSQDSSQPLNLSTSELRFPSLQMVTPSPPHRGPEFVSASVGTQVVYPVSTSPYALGMEKDHRTLTALGNPNGTVIQANVSGATNTTLTSVSPCFPASPCGTVPGPEHMPPTQPVSFVGAPGIHLPAHLVNGASGSVHRAIQVFTPEGYKLLPADQSTTNGTKPITITFAPTESLAVERSSKAEDIKQGPVMVTVKNGMQSLHVTVPSAAKALPQSLANANCNNSSAPLNLSLDNSTSPSYVPFPPNGLVSHIVPGMGLVAATAGSLVVSAPHRGNLLATGPQGAKSVKTSVLAAAPATSAPPGVPIVPAHYSTTLGGNPLGGFVNSLVVVSAPPTAAGSGSSVQSAGHGGVVAATADAKRP